MSSYELPKFDLFDFRRTKKKRATDGTDELMVGRIDVSVQAWSHHTTVKTREKDSISGKQKWHFRLFPDQVELFHRFVQKKFFYHVVVDS